MSVTGSVEMSNQQDQIQELADNWAEMGQQMVPLPLPPLEPPLLHNTRVSLHYRRRSIPTSVMVINAIKSQVRGPRDSVSFAAIKKFITLNYRTFVVDVNMRLRHVKRYILNALESGKLVRTKGQGVSGSFRLPSEGKLTTKMKRATKKKPNKKKLNVIRKQIGRQMKTMGTVAGASGSGGNAGEAGVRLGGGNRRNTAANKGAGDGLDNDNMQLMKTTSGVSLRRSGRGAGTKMEK